MAFGTSVDKPQQLHNKVEPKLFEAEVQRQTFHTLLDKRPCSCASTSSDELARPQGCRCADGLSAVNAQPKLQNLSDFPRNQNLALAKGCDLCHVLNFVPQFLPQGSGRVQSATV